MIGRIVRAENLSRAWLDALSCAHEHGDQFHLCVQIEDMRKEDQAIRRMANDFLEEWSNSDNSVVPINTVRNTIFPKTDVRFSRNDPNRLVECYREHYGTTRRFKGNRGGTYFGRIVSAQLNRKSEPYDQLTDTIRKLREPALNATRTEMDLRYEMDEPHAENNFPAIGVYQSEHDASKTMGFPCLSHLAFQRDGDRLHTVAFYRNQDLGRKAYGNYLGIAQLSAFIADHTQLVPGALTVIAGRAYFKGPVRMLKQFLRAAG